MRPDLLLLIADRYEMLAPASVALALRIPIAHIEGGEISEGAIDDAVRNALTKMSHIHFTSTDAARSRVIAMGEEAGASIAPARLRWTICGDIPFSRGSRIAIATGFDASDILVAFHPVTLARDTLREADALFAALEELPEQLLFCYPNADAGSRELIERARLSLLRATRPYVHESGALTYWSLLQRVDMLVGNSSSGIMESASFALPAVNIGAQSAGKGTRAQRICRRRRTRRRHPQCHRYEQKAPDFRRGLQGMTNPYGEGVACGKRLLKC